MKKLIIVILLIVLGVGVYKLWSNQRPSEYQGDTCDTDGGTTCPVNSTTTDATTEARIVVTKPMSQSKVSSPLEVSGKARGNWYFEASFPAVIKNAQGTIIGQGVAQADGEWMTTEFVPFTLEISFPAQQSGSTGTLVLYESVQKDGEVADSVIVPILF